MPVLVTPDAYGNTFEFSLTGLDEDGASVTVGLRPVNAKGEHSLSAVRYSGYPTGTLRGEAGEGEFSHKRKPFGEFSRRDWVGGIGELNAAKDSTKYWMGKRVWSMIPERMMLAPKLFRANISTPLRTGNEATLNYPVIYKSVAAGTRVAWKVTVARAATGIDVLLRSLVTNIITLNIKYDTDNAPGALISSETLTDVVLGGNRYQIEETIAAATIWIELSGTAAWEIGTSAQTDYTVMTSADGTTWSASDWDAPVFFLMEAAGADEWIFFNYRWGTYAVSGQKLYINGDRGACDDNSGNLNTVIDATKNWTTNEWAGAIVKVNQGAFGWRKIVSNDATTLTVDRPYTTAHGATTYYVIVGADKWTEITGHGFTADVCDVEVMRQDVVYFAMGPDQQMRRMQEKVETGAWSRTFDEDTVDTVGGTVLPGANFLRAVYDQVDGPVLYKVVNGDAVKPGYICKAPATTWGTDLTWGTEIQIGSDNWEDLSGIIDYDGKMAVTAMDSLWMVENGYAEKVSIDMENQWTGFTGRRPAVMPPYLIFPFGNRVQRMYQSIVESFGPERDSSLPKRYDGQVMDNLSLVGALAICKDGGKLGTYATDAEGGAFIYREGGWHPLAFTGLGSAMRGLWYQRREDEMDMIWFGDHNGLWYMYVPRGWDYTHDPMYNMTNRIEEDGWFITGWFDTGQLLPAKWWDFVTVFADQLSSASGRKIRTYYQVSDGTEYEVENLASNWTFTEEIDGGYNNTITINKQGRRIRFLFLLMGNGDSTPIMHGYTCDYISKDDDAESWQMSINIHDFGYDKQGTPDDMVTNKEKADILNYWARTVRPLTMHCEWPLWDNREVQILRPGLVPIFASEGGTEQYYASLTILGMEEPAEDPPEDESNCPLDAPVNGPYAITIAGDLTPGSPELAAGIVKTIRTAQHTNISTYSLTGTWYEFVDGAYVETSNDDFYEVYALDARGNIVATGVHDAVVPEALGTRTGTFTTLAATKIAAIKVVMNGTQTGSQTFYSYDLPTTPAVHSTYSVNFVADPEVPITMQGGPDNYAWIEEFGGGGDGRIIYDLGGEYFITGFSAYWKFGGRANIYGSTDLINWSPIKELWPPVANMTSWLLDEAGDPVATGGWVEPPINVTARYLKFHNETFPLLGGALRLGYFTMTGTVEAGKITLTGASLSNVCP